MSLRKRFAAWPVLLLIPVAGWLVTHGMAVALANRTPTNALRWNPGNAEALIRFNETERDVGRKIARARAVLRQRPVDGRAYRQLAEAAIAEGRADSARELYEIAARRSPRDRKSQAWLADDALARGNIPGALDRVALLISMDPHLRRALYQRLAELAGDETVARALALRLVQAPAWRADMLGHWAAGEQPVARLEVVHGALLAHGYQLQPTERAAWVDRLVREGQWHLAHRVWAAGLGPRRDPDNHVFNGGFEQPASGGFDWHFDVSPGVQIDQVLDETTGKGQALRIGFHDQRTDSKGVSQTLVLPSGPYVFRARARLAALTTTRGLAWTVSCANRLGERLATGPLLVGDHPFTQISFHFSVPDGCPAQVLRLAVDARIPAERRVAGTAWFDDVRVSGTGGLRTAMHQAPPGQWRPKPMPGTAPTQLEGGFSALVAQRLSGTLNAAGNLDADVVVGP